MKDGSAIVRSISGIEVSQQSIEWMDALQTIHQQGERFLRMMEMSEISLQECSKDEDGYLRALDLVLSADGREEAHLAKFVGSQRGQALISKIHPSQCDAIKESRQGPYINPVIGREFSIWLNIPLASHLRELLEEPEPSMGDALVGAFRSSGGYSKKDCTEFVYLIKAGNSQFLKIGITSDPHRRLKTLQSGNPLELQLLFFVKADRVLELSLLSKFSDLKVRGEWFKYSEKIISEFKSMHMWGAV